jgi:adenosylcobyric acid synthase
MLGKRILDTVESGAGEVEGLGLLPVETVFAPDKVLGNPAGHAPAFGGVPVAGYEIHQGRVRRFGGDPVLQGPGGDEGCRGGAVLGFTWHGVFEGDAFRRALLAWVAEWRGLEWVPGDRPFATVREQRLDLLGDLVAEHADTGALRRLIEAGAPPGMRLVPPGGPGVAG